MKNVACIIARTNSTRLPKKVLLDINGRTLIEHIIDRIKIVKNIDEIYIATSNSPDDKILGNIADKNNIKVYYGSETSVIDRMLDIGEKEDAQNLIRITGDNIFTDPEMLEIIVEAHLKANVEYSRAERLPIGTTAEVIDINALKRCYDSMDPDKSEYLFYYMFDPIKYKTLVAIPKDENLINEYASLTIDTPDDFERTKFIFNNIDRKIILYRDIVELSIRRDIPYFNINGNVKIKLPDNKSIEYKEFRKILDRKIEKSVRIHF